MFVRLPLCARAKPDSSGRAIDRLGRRPVGRARRRVASVADDERAAERAKGRLVEHVTDQSVVLDDRDLLILKGGHASRLLTAVLQRVERVVTERCHRPPRRHDPHDATGFFHSAFSYGLWAAANTGPVSHSSRSQRPRLLT